MARDVPWLDSLTVLPLVFEAAHFREVGTFTDRVQRSTAYARLFEDEMVRDGIAHTVLQFDTGLETQLLFIFQPVDCFLRRVLMQHGNDQHRRTTLLLVVETVHRGRKDKGDRRIAFEIVLKIPVGIHDGYAVTRFSLLRDQYRPGHEQNDHQRQQKVESRNVLLRTLVRYSLRVMSHILFIIDYCSA
ncbi:hypothetical protein ACQ86N_39495 [Puia sp. P3]|uniref:hypothetical protein n=1 Tax=Puia sp. P3 TaxID=3423952 RepID=UPI003D67ECF4